MKGTLTCLEGLNQCMVMYYVLEIRDLFSSHWARDVMSLGRSYKISKTMPVRNCMGFTTKRTVGKVLHFFVMKT